MTPRKTCESEIKEGLRFKFGKNWQGFLSTLTEERIEIAKTSITEMLRVKNLSGKTVLDIGSGSGLFSLAARRLDASVVSFDYDPESVACARELRQQYTDDTEDQYWIIQEGSVLDKTFLWSLGTFDLVYSWGVLHHTGDMWAALGNAASLVKKNGTLFVAIYNDQGMISKFWRRVKVLYCSGLPGKAIVSTVFIPYLFSRALLSCILTGKNVFSEYKQNRGMSITHDWFDWLGGLPFEVASVDRIFHFFRDRGFTLDNIKTSNGGNNQFVFVKKEAVKWLTGLKLNGNR